MRGFHNMFQLDPDDLLSYISRRRKVTRSQTLKDKRLYTRSQVAYGLDKLHKQGKVHRYRGKDGAFIYIFKPY